MTRSSIEQMDMPPTQLPSRFALFTGLSLAIRCEAGLRPWTPHLSYGTKPKADFPMPVQTSANPSQPATDAPKPKVWGDPDQQPNEDLVSCWIQLCNCVTFDVFVTQRLGTGFIMTR